MTPNMTIKNNPIPEDVTLYTVTEVAKLLKTNKGYVYQLIHAGLLPCVQIGHIKVRQDSLAEFLRKAEGYNYNDPYNVVRAS